MTHLAPTPPELQLALAGPDDTDALGAALAGWLGAGDTVLLSGPIGAGKSQLARATIRVLMDRHGVPREDIPSPTYTLVQSYDLGGGLEVWHADLYRLGGPEEVLELGLEAAFGTAICLVEWPDRLGRAAPDSALRIVLADDPASDGRRARLQAGGARWSAVLRRLAPGRASG